MSARDVPTVRYRFVALGVVAPDPLPPAEVWLDVGGRVAPRVFDHHGGDTAAWSASQLVLERGAGLLAEFLNFEDEITLITHHKPDLDAAASTWLTSRCLSLGTVALEGDSIQDIVSSVSANDQGLVRDTVPERNWPIVARTFLATEGSHTDEQSLRTMHEFLDRTLEILDRGLSLGDAAERLISPTVQNTLAHARRQYLEDMSRAHVFQVRLPVGPSESVSLSERPEPAAAPDMATEEWSLADGVHFDDPISILFKELARSDTKGSPGGAGFQLMVVSRSVPGRADPHLWRHVVSTDPTSGFNLEGLGPLLEKAERKAEGRFDLPLRPGRTPLEVGKGRHGYDVESPWYDGRGHAFTIVDSPAYEENGRQLCASLLQPSEVLTVVRRYGSLS